MIILRLALLSLWNRRGTVLLTVLGIAVSVALLLGVNTVRNDLRTGFANTISDADLIVGARSGPVNLLLYSVFHLGDATADVSWQTYSKVAAHPQVAWTIPLALGDSHRDFRVLGTTGDYFAHYKYGQQRSLAFAAGRGFNGAAETVLGAEVARALGYQLGQSLVLSHGLGEGDITRHEGQPVVVVGILRRTGTPVDRTVHVTLQAIEAMHAGPGASLEPESITAFVVGLRDRVAAFQIQRDINAWRGEALLAIMPGVTLQQLWQVVGLVEIALYVVAGFVVFAGLLGLLTALLTSLNERRREMAILRSVGARPAHIAVLLMSEAGLTGFAGVLVGIGLLHGGLWFAAPLLEQRFGIALAGEGVGTVELALAVAVVLASVLIGAVPAWRAYRNTLADGLTLRV